MKLTQLKAKPQLIKISLDDEDTVKQYGEAVDFWVYDRQTMDVFVRLATVKTDNMAELFTLINTMVLDEDGKPIITSEDTLPMDVMSKVIQKVVERLGK
jgi:hypothetical protein